MLLIFVDLSLQLVIKCCVNKNLILFKLKKVINIE